MLIVTLKLVDERFIHYNRLVYVKGVYPHVLLLIYGRLQFNQFNYMPHKLVCFVSLIVYLLNEHNHDLSKSSLGLSKFCKKYPSVSGS